MDLDSEDRTIDRADTTTIKLAIGEPDMSMIPYDLISKATQEMFNDKIGKQQGTYWIYGPDEGNSDLRHHIVNFLHQTCRISTISYENIFITNGVSAMLDQLCTMFLRAGDSILVECPSYLYALSIFRDHHLHIVSYATDHDGLIIDSKFIDVLERVKPKMIYLVPTFQNPSGFTMSHHRREQLVQLSLKYHFLIVADEVYHFLDYTKKESNGNGYHNQHQIIEHPKSFASYHAAGTVIALQSFSKILAPSLRLGFACASHEHVNAMARYGLIHSGGGANPFVSGIVDRILVQGSLKQFIDEKLCVEYGKRMDFMYNELMRTFGEQYITCQRPTGGYFIWVQFNDKTVDCDQLLAVAAKHGVTFKPGRLFAHDVEAKAHIANCLRLCIAIADCNQLKEGCARLKRAFEEYKNVVLH